MHYRYKRYLTYFIITFIVMASPFITISGNHLFLLSFAHSEFHFLWCKFNIQQLYVMVFLLIFLFIGVFFLTSMLGRIWCGWGCPQTIFRVIFRDLLETKILNLRDKISDKQRPIELNNLKNTFKFAIAVLVFAFIAFVAASNLILYFVDYKEYFAALKDPLNNKIILGFVLCFALALILDVVFIREKFCAVICPYARVQSVLFDDDTKTIIYDKARGGDISLNIRPKIIDKNSECVGCQHCVKVCPAHIDIRNGLQFECINCLECVDACTDIMAKVKSKTLISWSSFNAIKNHDKIKYFRLKTIAYMVVLAVIAGIILYLSTTAQEITINVNRDSQLFTKRKSGAIDNFYILLIQNNTDEKQEFKITVSSKYDIEVLSPKDTIAVNAKSKHKVLLILRSKAPLNGKNGTTLLPIDITASTTNDRKISKDSIFATP